MLFITVQLSYSRITIIIRNVLLTLGVMLFRSCVIFFIFNVCCYLLTNALMMLYVIYFLSG